MISGPHRRPDWELNMRNWIVLSGASIFLLGCFCTIVESEIESEVDGYGIPQTKQDEAKDEPTTFQAYGLEDEQT